MLFDAIEADVHGKEEFVQNMAKRIQEMKNDINKLDDYIRVLNFVNGMLPQIGANARPVGTAINDGFGVSPGDNQIVDSSEPMLGGVSFISGTIRQEEEDRLKKMVFRATRGKALCHTRTFSQDGVDKVVYMVVFQDIANTADRVQKICDSFMGQRFDVPELARVAEVTTQTTKDITKSRDLLRTSEL